MQPNKIFSLIILLSLLLLLGSVQVVQAEPAPDKLVVNHETKECATIFGGDECMDCMPPEGWAVLGWSYQAECPEGYTFTQVEEICTPFKDEFCCTDGHSGAHGDCDDLVINETDQQCVFVEDINACNLPTGWEAKSADGYWACPRDFDWIENLECLDEPAPQQGDSDSGSGLLPFRCGGSALGGLLLSSVFLFTIRRKSDL
jgi:hypothetical protein